IRDRNVTGVQTCALPIYLRQREGGRPRTLRARLRAHQLRGHDPELRLARVEPRALLAKAAERLDAIAEPDQARPAAGVGAADPRSEERRVGEGGRARGSA